MPRRSTFMMVGSYNVGNTWRCTRAECGTGSQNLATICGSNVLDLVESPVRSAGLISSSPAFGVTCLRTSDGMRLPKLSRIRACRYIETTFERPNPPTAWPYRASALLQFAVARTPICPLRCLCVLYSFTVSIFPGSPSSPSLLVHPARRSAHLAHA